MIHFNELNAPKPELDGVADQSIAILDKIQSSQQTEDVLTSMKEWDQQRREVGTYLALVYLRFTQNTADLQAKQAKDESDAMRPKLTELENNIKKALVQHPCRQELEQQIGSQMFSLWESEIPTFDPTIAEDLIEESGLESQYTALTASAEFEFNGETHNHSTIGKYREYSDRELRYGAEKVKWQWFEENGDELDDIYDKMVQLRHAMSQKLGFENYVELAYLKMCRVDYDQQDVARYRQMVRDHVTPLGEVIREQQAQALGIEKTMYWDEAVYLSEGNPLPPEDYNTMIRLAQEMFDQQGYGLDDFFRVMTEGGYMDLQSRKGKAGGGYCMSFDTIGMPFIFANFKGTRADVEVFTHEMGHAFQGYMSRNQPWIDYLWPTYESCEIHSMGLEFLTYPQMDLFFGDRADQFRRIHLSSSLMFLPYGVSVDEYQHRVYEKPNATREERHTMWKDIEQSYMPFVDYGDLPHAPKGARWHDKQHIFRSPFYYIDYTLAQTCALQFWIRAQQDRATAMDDYVALCKRGGEAPFQQLVKGANLISPFEQGCLEGVVKQSRVTLGL